MAGKRTRAQAAGIKKRKATLAAKKTTPSTQAAKATKEKGIHSVAEEEEQEGDELGDVPMVIDDHDDDDLLKGALTLFGACKPKALMSEEKRKQELHELDIRQREAQTILRHRTPSHQRLSLSRASASPLLPYDNPRRPHLRCHHLLRRLQAQAIQERWESLGDQDPGDLVKKLHHLRPGRLCFS
jgi:hypothetical protein